ncbi:myosin-11-like isoform X1 [Aricia agestis]|uniref:myosin-11-like isoform X1 n=1 Tax=Aricia agestis TaxID=91739 RepID=UPI001C201B99|nr:myosin-11-like isoform X1 [Aricia agestis]
MNIDGDMNADEYFVTAVQIFDCCGVDKSSTVSVSTLMDKFAPFAKTNKSEYTFLRSLLDPDQNDPEITVSKLAATLNYYSENQKIKLDLDESFNLKGGQVPQDSDSGISSDGFQILEELQCELREKSHMAHSLRTQLDLASRDHEEALGAVIAERDTLRAQLNVMREENASLSAARADCEEACERLAAAERALAEARQELGAVRRRASRTSEQLAVMEAEKLTLQELLAQSKQECHRINEMYASRQSVLLEENEALKTDHADLSTRLQDQEEYMQQMIKEKVILEMELKDVLNKSNHIHSRIDRSIDVSYTDDQMLTALDSLNAESKFIQDSRTSILDEESFLKALHEDSGRPTNMSLFDEIRLSFCNKSKLNLSELNTMEYFEKRYSHLDSTFDTVGTQTDKSNDIDFFLNKKNKDNVKIQQSIGIQTVKETKGNIEEEVMKLDKRDTLTQVNTVNKNVSIQTDKEDNRELTCFTTELDIPYKEGKDVSTNTSTQMYEVFKEVEVMNFGVNTEPYSLENKVKNCIECDKLKEHATNLVNDLKNTQVDCKKQIKSYEKNISLMRIMLDETNTRNEFMKSLVDNLKSKINILESAYVEQNKRIDDLNSKSACEIERDVTSVGTQAEVPCAECVKYNAPTRSIRRFFWDSIKCLFQLFAVVCFVCAVCVLYGVRRAPCRELPARWLRPADLVDMLLRVEYVADVPM